MSIEEYKILSRQLKLIMETDKNATHNNGYHLSSLYFDDLYDSATYDKADGVEYHRKYRIRTYENGHKRLEYKVKNGNTSTKEYYHLTDEVEQALINRDYSVLQNYLDDTLIKNILLKMKINDLKPRLYVDYFREVYTFNNDDIRITFDKDIIAYNWYNSNNRYKVLEPRQIIMEVKYRTHFPDFIRKVVFKKNYTIIPYSKYLMSWLKLNNWGI